MSNLVDAHYLSVEWQKPGVSRHVKVDPYPIEIHLRPDGGMHLEAQIFNDFHPWLGLRLSGALASETPAFITAQGTLRPMLAVSDDQGGRWWVQDDGWDTEGQRHFSELHRTIGCFEIVIGDQSLSVENVALELGRAQIEEYLHDFKGDLIWLVMGFGSATASAGASSGDRKLVAALANFTLAARRVVNNPDQNIRETVALTPIARLRPNAATFRHHARMPAAQRLIGRVTEKTADIADNGYLRHMLQVCQKLTCAVALSADRQLKIFNARAQGEAQRSTDQLAIKSRLVDPEIFSRQQEELQEKLACVTNFVDENELYENARIREYRLIITGVYNNSSNQFFFKRTEEESDRDIGKDINYSVIKIPEDLSRSIIAALGFSNEYTICGTAIISFLHSSKGKRYRFTDFKYIESIFAHTQALENKQRKRLILEKNNWSVNLSYQEIKEMRQEAKTAASRAKEYLKRAERTGAAANVLITCQADLQRQDQLWQKLGVTTRMFIPMGMRYTQNTNYVACLAAFIEVQALAEQSGIGEKALDDLEQMGILHASAIYEHWCLVKILSVLIEDFAFTPELGWQDRLIHAVTALPENLCLNFKRQDIEMIAILEIQPIFPNGRRPDFKLSFKAKSDSQEPTVGIVMDAKFRTKWRKGSMESMLNELLYEKNYDQLGDRVFIIQPAGYTVTKPTSPLEWGRNCDYGHDQGHQYGSIQLAPGKGVTNPVSNLRRLIAMQLQASFDTPYENPSNYWNSNSFCIRCGKSHISSDITPKETKSRSPYWTFQCAGCSMETTRTHCMGIGCNTILFKNGIFLTYHNTLADQITNIVCPKCASHFDAGRRWP